MSKKINKLITKYSSEFDSIVLKINNYIDFHNSNNQYSADDAYHAAINCVNSLARLAEFSFEHGNFKDTWEYGKFYQNIEGPELIINSLKTKSNYRIGLDSKGIYLSTDLRHNENLRYMNDKFWKDLLELEEFEGFEYEEYEFTSDDQRKKFPHLFKTNKSMIFRIMRKYIFDNIHEDLDFSSSCVGEFRISWSKDKDFEFLVRKCCVAFKIMYSLNYRLWKIGDLKTKKAISK